MTTCQSASGCQTRPYRHRKKVSEREHARELPYRGVTAALPTIPCLTIDSQASGSAETPRHFRAAKGVLPTVPAIDGFRLGFDGAMRQHGVIYSTAHDPKRR
jgi:hypothetical protein